MNSFPLYRSIPLFCSITIEYYRPRKWSDMDLASFCPFGWRLGAGGGPVSRGDNPQTAHLATRIKLFIVIKPMFEGEVMVYIVRSRSNAIFSERVWGRKPAWCKSSFSRRTKGTKVLFLKRLKSRGSWSNDLSLHIS